jgi:predicted Fe-Mo cluster-binding NifX family protein
MEKARKICIPSMGPDAGDFVDERFGRAPFFIIYDTGSEKTEYHKNPAAQFHPRVLQESGYSCQRGNPL